MRYIDRLDSGRGIAVEYQEPVRAEHFDPAIKPLLLDVQRPELGAEHASAAVVRALIAQADKADEDLSRRFLRWALEPLKEILGLSRKRSADTPHPAIDVEPERRLRSLFEQLRECVLEQRQAARLVGDVAHDGRDQARLE